VPRSRWAWAVLVAALLLARGPMAYMIGEGRQVLARLEREGVGMTGRAWQESESLGWARSLPSDALLYSNKALFLQFLLHREAYQLPEGFDPLRREERPDFPERLARMYSDLARPNSYLLMFDPDRPLDVADLNHAFTIGMVPVLRTRDGVVLQKAALFDFPWEAPPSVPAVMDKHEPQFGARIPRRAILARVAGRDERNAVLRFLFPSSDASSSLAGANLVGALGWTAW